LQTAGLSFKPPIGHLGREWFESSAAHHHATPFLITDILSWQSAAAWARRQPAGALVNARIASARIGSARSTIASVALSESRK
jgi:hypothetical protein